jgi:hypothetical protein
MKDKLIRRPARITAVAVLATAAAFVAGLAFAPAAASAHAYKPCHIVTCE